MKEKIVAFAFWVALAFFVGFAMHYGKIVGESIWPNNPIKVEIGAEE